MNLSPAALQQKGYFVRLKLQYYLQCVCNTDHVSIYNDSEDTEINSVLAASTKELLKSAMQHQIKNPIYMQEDLTIGDVHGQHE